jgi:DNA polymerase III sliding clamp (beta) subunit (PCNA family)
MAPLDTASTIHNPYDDGATCAMALADFEALGLDPTPTPGTFLVDLDVRTLRALLPFASEDETRYNLCGILVEVDAAAKRIRLVATDGFTLAVVERCPAGDDRPGAWDVFGAMGDRDDTAFILSRGACERAIKCAPKPTKSYRPTVQVEVKIGTDGAASCLALLSGQARITDAVVDGCYPDWRQVVPARADVASTEPFAINVTFLARAQALADLTTKGVGVRVQPNGALAPIRFDAGHGVYGAVMPMRP